MGIIRGGDQGNKARLAWCGRLRDAGRWSHTGPGGRGAYWLLRQGNESSRRQGHEVSTRVLDADVGRDQLSRPGWMSSSKASGHGAQKHGRWIEGLTLTDPDGLWGWQLVKS